MNFPDPTGLEGCEPCNQGSTGPPVNIRNDIADILLRLVAVLNYYGWTGVAKMVQGIADYLENLDKEGDKPWVGEVADVQIHSVALSAQQIQVLSSHCFKDLISELVQPAIQCLVTSGGFNPWVIGACLLQNGWPAFTKFFQCQFGQSETQARASVQQCIGPAIMCLIQQRGQWQNCIGPFIQCLLSGGGGTGGGGGGTNPPPGGGNGGGGGTNPPPSGRPPNWGTRKRC